MLLPSDLGLFTLDKLGVARSTLYDWCPSLNGLRQMGYLGIFEVATITIGT